jgi:two-component system CheB/CheR fusion protein
MQDHDKSLEANLDTVPVIVGLGASAGGQDAFARFLAAVPADTGMAFVLVQHLDPHQRSLLAELAQRHTTLSVQEIEEGQRAQPNSVYVIPPNHNIDLLHGIFHLTPLDTVPGPRLTIDHFFQSLAQDQGERAVGIVLSGSGSDGAHGVRLLKAEGSLTLAQTPATAAHSSMPQSAIATGCIDQILPPEQMPAYLLRCLRLFGRTTQTPLASSADGVMHRIFILLRARTGHDFSQYKRKTVQRRITRRMAVQQIEQIEDYYQYLRHVPMEVNLLAGEFLIGVTEFFRNPEAFEILGQLALPPLFTARPPEDPIRVWVPACASGEEAYSIAILLYEYQNATHNAYPIQIFATDLDGAAISRARLGHYPLGIAAHLGPERLEQFFVMDESGYQIKDLIRSSVVFATQSVIKDPPFSRVDLISCRNLLIYLQPMLQKKVLQLLHYALKPGGFLFLGNSENADAFPHLFTPINRQWKIYQRIANTEPRPLAPSALDIPRISNSHELARIPLEPAMNIRQTLEQWLLDRAPPCVLVNGQGDILYVHGRTGAYLELASGEGIDANVLRLAREGLSSFLGAALRQVQICREPVIYEHVRMQGHDGFQNIRLSVHPLPKVAIAPELNIIQFETLDSSSAPPSASASAEKRIATLEWELRATREYLQTTIQDLEASNEEMKSSNEEIQSANEELESSREELQSVNEELVTLNAEHEQKIAELLQVNNDLNNVLSRIDIGIIFLDNQLHIRRFNAAATRISNLIGSDLGRPLSDIVSKLNYPALLDDARAVLDQLSSRECEVQTREGGWYWMCIRPYRTADNVIDGVMLTFTNISEQKTVQQQLQQAQQDIQAARVRAESLIANIVDLFDAPLAVLDSDMRIVTTNRAFRQYGQIKATDASDYRLRELIHESADLRPLQALLTDESQTPEPRTLELPSAIPNSTGPALRLTAQPIRAPEGGAPLLLVTFDPASIS